MREEQKQEADEAVVEAPEIESIILAESSEPEAAPRPVTPPDHELIRKRNYVLEAQIIGDYIERGELSCPNCGGKKLVWQCCGLDIADPKTIERIRGELKKG